MPYKHLNPTERRIFNIYYGMVSRCEYVKNVAYARYGGRGIKICSEWRKGWKVFYKWALANGYKEGLTLDRIDYNKNYEPNNCRWATRKEQANNMSSNVLIPYNGQIKNLSEWCEELNLSRSRINYRLSQGMSFEEAVKTPSLRGKHKKIKEVNKHGMDKTRR